nr:HDIG domain-containing protein [Phycisphaerales bacterium]
VFARPRRLASLAMLFAGGLALACGIALIDPRAMIAAACVPAALVAAVLAVAYERRTALAVASLLGLAGALAVRLPIEAAVLPLAAAGLVVWQLREIRHRGTLIRTGVIAGALLVAMTLLVEQLSLPLSEAALPQMLFAAGAAGVGVLLACFVVLGLLPTIERAFGVLTPLTLIELRDPRHPLLQVLQQRAPGTWVHSMNVANLTEQACQAIGADGLLAHVGALYHDCGKMNRPEMFVENQSGINRHDKLSPSMSLLLIVSHVADGLEMAREHALPQPLWHFIEAHHGTTVVEYFYHRARKQHDEACQQAGKSVDGQPDEKQYRYPGPKPRTKEVAVMMICDAAEGAARAMTDPTAVKLEAMVRSIADKRLADAQFDQCELTMREISTIVATVSRSLASIHHGRVAYPDAARRGAGAAGAPGGGPKPIVSQG